MTNRRRSGFLAAAQLVCTIVLAFVVFAEPKHHPSAGWIAADVAIVLLMAAISLGSVSVSRRQLRRDGRSPTFRRSALLPILVLVAIAFVVQRLIS
jgi:uncharacterized membrane protein